MKPPLRALALLLLACLGIAGIAYAADQLWTCGMHPQIIKTEPGNCPICGMKLTPIRDDAANATSKNSIRIDAATTQRMNLKTALVERGPVRREINALGIVAYDEAGLIDITTKYEGWVEKLHVNTTWAEVKAGQPLFEIYSPDLYNAQLNYVMATRAESAEAGPLQRAAQARLELFDMPEEAIAELKRSGEVQRAVVFRAPADGVVIEKMAVSGQMIRPGERIFRIAELSSVWVQAQIYEQDLAFVSVGQAAEVQLDYGAQQTFEGAVELLAPQLDDQTRAVTARIALANPEGILRPGMFVTARLSAQIADDAVLVPDVAVLRSGERDTVFVALEDGFFEPREVTLGARSSGNRYQVLSGLEAGERIVVSGQFMLDSESQLREAIQKMRRAGATSGAMPGHQHGAASAPAARSRPTAAQPQAADVIPARALALLEHLALASADAAAALAADDVGSYRAQLPELNGALASYFSGYEHAAHGPLSDYEGGLPEAADLKAARAAFEPFSTAIADLARANGLHESARLRVFECPMAPEAGVGRWLQREAGTRNPFFGSDMLTCGGEIAGPAR